MRYLILAGCIALGSCTTTPQGAERAAVEAAETQAGLEAELAGLVPGEPTDCLPTPIRTQVNSRTFGSTIVYRVSDRQKYRNDTTGGCERASDGRAILITSNPIGRSCRGDIVQTVDPVSRIPLGSCALGAFTPYRRP